MTKHKRQSSNRWQQRALGAGLLLATFFATGLAKTSGLTGSPNSIDAMYRSYRAKFPDVPDISVDQLLTQGPANFIFVDVRTPKERAVSSIPNSITQQEFEQRPELSRGKVIVAFCTIGYRSGLYAQKLRRHGRDVRNLRGGLLAWCHAGQPVVNAVGPTNRVHVYGRKWNLLPERYQGVW